MKQRAAVRDLFWIAVSLSVGATLSVLTGVPPTNALRFWMGGIITLAIVYFNPPAILRWEGKK